MRKNEHAVALGRRGARRGGLARSAALTAERRKEIACQGAMARWGKPVAGVPILTIGRRIERGARNELAEAIRRSVWESKGPGKWREICRRSLQARLTSSWVPVVELLGRV